MVEVGKSQERLNLLPTTRHRPFHHSLNLDWVHFSFAFQNDQSEVFNCCFHKFTLFGSKVQLVLSETFENALGDLAMFGKGL